mmetsp:Transcript_20485/g.48660  ORF Transcript_20485/g.48660 Transcript_20485/m.48660 type:complete len:660 (-) Transcript_20485:79-2058(-)
MILVVVSTYYMIVVSLSLLSLAAPSRPWRCCSLSIAATATGAMIKIFSSSSSLSVSVSGSEAASRSFNEPNGLGNHDQMLLLIESLSLDNFYINGSFVEPLSSTQSKTNPPDKTCSSPLSSSRSDEEDGSSYDDHSQQKESSCQQPIIPSTLFVDVTDPSTAQIVAQIPVATSEDVDFAVRSAREACESSWGAFGHTSPLQRHVLVEKFLQLYIENSDNLAKLISIEMGSPYVEAKTSHVGGGRYNIETFLDIHRHSFEYERSLQSSGADDGDGGGGGGFTTILYEPVGVVGLITPWNWPLNQLTLKIIPALLVGCTCVVKPSEESPLSAALLAELFHQSGFPPGVINFVHGDGVTTGEALSRHPDVDMISFTGSTLAGKLVAENAARHLAKTTLELGGKGAYIVFADLLEEEWIKEVVTNCADSVFYNTGQSCNAPTRLFVERPFYERAVQWAKETADLTFVESAHFQHHAHDDDDDERVENGENDDDDDGHIGPVVNRRQFDRIQRLIEIGIDEGAELVAGGLGRPDHLHDQEGFFVRPTVFAGCTTNMTIMQEEIFGPVLCITPFDTEDEVVKMANDTPYGLTNYVHSRSLERRRRLARLLRSGMVEMNDAEGDDGSPFGGIKSSGYGREGGIYGLEEFCTIKSITGYHELDDDVS